MYRIQRKRFDNSMRQGKWQCIPRITNTVTEKILVGVDNYRVSGALEKLEHKTHSSGSGLGSIATKGISSSLLWVGSWDERTGRNLSGDDDRLSLGVL